MTSSASSLGSIAALWRFPVKSMLGERVEKVNLTPAGVFGDRAYALLDVSTGKVVSAKSAKLFPGLLDCKAAFVHEPQPGKGLPAVLISLPSGKTVRSDSADVDEVLTRHFKRPVRLARQAPEDFTIDQYHPDLEDNAIGSAGGSSAEQKLGAALFESIGAPSPVPQGSFLDAFPLSLITTSTLSRLGQLAPASCFDERRFRMNIIVSTVQPGFVENHWSGSELALGDCIRLQVAMPDPRCVMTSLAQEELPEDIEVLRTLVRHNRLDIPGMGALPCAGVYALVLGTGSVQLGDTLRA